MTVNPVIVVPVYQQRFDEFELISIAHLRRELSGHRIVVIKPDSLDIHVEGADYEVFPEGYFSGRDGYNKLMLSPMFYERFAGHSHVLIYQLDALVFRDELVEWCNAGYDYIGASWYPELIQRYAGFTWDYATQGCGNGGFSLRRVKAFRKHLENRHSVSRQLMKSILGGNFACTAIIWKYRRYLDLHNYIHHESLNEDVYWGVFASIFDPSFKVAPPDVGDRFAFEYDPAHLFRRTNGHLPFGCHAWYRFPDALDFYRPYLRRD